jgi:putative PIN family toxin of toxin-antitoxin system
VEIAVFDSNVWVSDAGFPGSVPHRAIDLARAGLVRSVTSPPIVEQVRRAVAGPKFPWLAAIVDEIEAEMKALSRLVQPTVTLAVITAKESDNRVLECAVAGGATVIVTGDRTHLLPLGSYAGIPIVAPADFLRAFER